MPLVRPAAAAPVKCGFDELLIPPRSLRPSVAQRGFTRDLCPAALRWKRLVNRRLNELMTKTLNSTRSQNDGQYRLRCRSAISSRVAITALRYETTLCVDRQESKKTPPSPLFLSAGKLFRSHRFMTTILRSISEMAAMTNLNFVCGLPPYSAAPLSLPAASLQSLRGIGASCDCPVHAHSHLSNSHLVVGVISSD